MECCLSRLVRDHPTNYFYFYFYCLNADRTYHASDLYHLVFPKDKPLYKWLVSSVYLLETVDIIFLTYDALTDFRNVFGLSVPISSRNTSTPVQFSWLRMYILGGIGKFTLLHMIVLIHIRRLVTCIVQSYYAYHLNHLRRSKIFTAAIFLVDLTSSLVR